MQFLSLITSAQSNSLSLKVENKGTVVSKVIVLMRSEVTVVSQQWYSCKLLQQCVAAINASIVATCFNNDLIPIVANKFPKMVMRFA
jgi:hypothetical protein